MNLSAKKYLYFTLLVIVLQACKMDKEPEWKTQLLFPLVNTELGLQNLADDSLIKTASDSSLSLVYTYVMNSLSMDTLLKIPDTTLTKTVTLKSIKLGKRVINQRITLGEIARKNGMILPQGFSVPIPPISNINAGTFELDATD